MDAYSYLVIVLVSATALAIGHWLGATEPSETTFVAVECGVRHPVMALTIGIGNFSGQRRCAGDYIPVRRVMNLVANSVAGYLNNNSGMNGKIAATR